MTTSFWPSHSSIHPESWRSELLFPKPERNHWTPDTSADWRTRPRFISHLNQIDRKCSQILTKRWQSGDFGHRVCKFGVVKHARDILPLIQGCRKEVWARLCVWACFVISLRLFFRVQHQRDMGIRSPPRWNAGDHPKLTSSFLYHFCFNRHIWCCCRAEEKHYTFTQADVSARKCKSQKSHWGSFWLFLSVFCFSQVGSQNRMIWILAKHGSWGASAGIFWKVLTLDYHLSHLLAGAAAKSRCLAQLLPLEPGPGELSNAANQRRPAY